MTREEVKESVSMQEILQHCGMPAPNRAGFIPCPFHKGDRTPSMKIYPKDYHCFACGANGDIFTFLEQYEGISFREAFLELGGEYPDAKKESWFARRRRQYERQKRQETAAGRARAEEAEKEILRRTIRLLWTCVRLFEPLSDAWCDSYNQLQFAAYKLEYLNRKR